MASNGAKPVPRRARVDLQRGNAPRFSFERRMKLWVWTFFVPVAGCVWAVGRAWALTWVECSIAVCMAALMWCIVAAAFLDQVYRPLQTLTNIVSALRENDFAFRARGAARGDVLGDLALEINRLAGALQVQRNSAIDALSLADRVINSMPSPVLAFDAEGRLRLLNSAGERTFRERAEEALGRSAEQLDMTELLTVEDGSILASHRNRNTPGTSPVRWSVQRSTFRLHGLPHTLVVLSDVAAALREEERSAWQRLIRVLSHEINNSLTPIKSLAGMLRSRPLHLSSEFHTSQDLHDLRRGLAMIEDRAGSLNRFLQAYQQLSRLPLPRLRPVLLSTVVEQTVLMERRVPIHVAPSPPLQVEADPDQLQQLLINVLKNAAEAATDAELQRGHPHIHVVWRAEGTSAVVHVVDNGPGLSNPANLFVPFYTTKPEGAGIGLTLCQQIASAHHGSITLQNRRDGTGCMVQITLPLAENSAHSANSSN